MIRKIFLTIIGLLSVAGALAESPEDMLRKCVEKLKGATTVTADFTMNMNGRSVGGTIRSKGKRFAVTTASNGTWYNGNDIWAYTASSGEVTVWHPSASELAESNPLLYLSTASDYTVKSGATASTLILTPKKRNAGVKSITLTVNPATGLPKGFDIAANGGNIRIAIKSLCLNAPVDDSSFNFPKSKYPKAVVTDLR